MFIGVAVSFDDGGSGLQRESLNVSFDIFGIDQLSLGNCLDFYFCS